MTITPTTRPGLSADEILYLLAGQRTVHLGQVSLLITTGTHTPAPGEPTPWPYTPGEIVVIDYTKNGAELLGDRDDDAWHTSARYTTSDLEEAIALSELVRSGAERGIYQWDGRVWFLCPDQQEAHHLWCSVGNDGGVFIGDTDGENTYGRDIAYPGSYSWPTAGGGK
jgi:hypothetical protein